MKASLMVQASSLMLAMKLTVILAIVFVSGLAAEDVIDWEAKEPTNTEDVEVVEGKGGNYKFVEEDNVLVLTRDNFHYFVMSRPVVLVDFYAPWCGHCQTLAPEYSKASEQLKKENVTLAKVDATKEVELAKEFMITGYPSIILFRNAIINYMKEKLDPNWKSPASRVVVLTSANFSNVVESSSLILVEFYAKWCKHCQQLEPEYEAAARSLLEYGIPLAKVDGPSEKELAERLNIIGWPTLKVFRKGRIFDYKGPREHQGIVEHMKLLSRSPSKIVNSIGEMKSALDRKDTSVIGLFSSKTALYENFLAAAEQLRGIFTCLHTFDSQVTAHYGINDDAIVVQQPEIFHSQHEKPFYVFSSVILLIFSCSANGSVDDIMEFIRIHSIPLVGQRTKRNEIFKYSAKPLVIVYYDVNFDHQYVKDTQFVRKKVLEVAKVFQPTSIKFAISNEDEYVEELRALNLADATEDVKVAVYDGPVKFRMEPSDDLEPEELKEFVKLVISGKGKPFYRSQPVPKVQEGPVLNVVADSFAQSVIQSKQDVLIEFFAPWCGHCKALEPEYKKLAKRMKKDYPNLIVAKMDATANDLHPMFGQLKGYPSIFYIPADNKENIVQYEGKPFTYKDLKAFIVEQQLHAHGSSADKRSERGNDSSASMDSSGNDNEDVNQVHDKEKAPPPKNGEKRSNADEL
nr:EOG090X0438 [Ilyocryptus agilis]